MTHAQVAAASRGRARASPIGRLRLKDGDNTAVHRVARTQANMVREDRGESATFSQSSGWSNVSGSTTAGAKVLVRYPDGGVWRVAAVPCPRVGFMCRIRVAL